MKTTNKFIIWSEQHKQYINKKEKELLKFLKADVKNWEDELWSVELFDREVARFYKVDHKVNNKKIKYESGKGKYPLLVKTHMFWWSAKHINIQEYKSFKIK